MVDREQLRDVTTADGVMPVYVAYPKTAPAPLIVMYMDVNGIRDELRRFAARLAGHGFVVALPDLYYRFGTGIAFDHRTAVHERPQAEIDHLRTLMTALKDEMVMRDTLALVAAFEDDPRVAPGRAGSIGYCMGGRFVVRTLTELPDYFAAGAAHFPTSLVTDAEDAPYRSLSRASGPLYMCFGSEDFMMPAERIDTLRRAIAEADIDCTLVVHPGAPHSYAFAERPSSYDAAAAEEDWAQSIALFQKVLAVR
ncbi:carboxymethylenebutenolidase [Sphingomonas vulcanisoli]|uniref:Carboxymethylenebutenolidase n=1 Tax=Sphingomonas vulcanisoli TaxID=1658060 RepID=A0ABX0TWR7_9SPHN|nr:dienelactone hydrolase family protein [Sphingomonas vulcanisoli]NIJ08862.1 carboxymethylenebutenolidase [Sphingomonas vulcanisoli]